MTADQLAEMANRIEADFLNAASTEMKEWYGKLPRATKVKMMHDAMINASKDNQR